MSTESFILKEIVETLGSLGNMCTLSPDEQQKRVDDMLGISPSTQRVNIHKLAIHTNLTYTRFFAIASDTAAATKNSVG
ncbi:hypothetical protein RCL_jg11442.t1 [Rhizophagus clarus]|uniref:Uncharacterized protein n=1 Tax=Rhizophagus clarus TaxID=94130 RepID=A0A8H3LDI5_9GLOM|nr:hypothetical protein RCL_jg11442.t1 [Rhizophagus clarus]